MVRGGATTATGGAPRMGGATRAGGTASFASRRCSSSREQEAQCDGKRDAQHSEVRRQ